jgi:hypothetical protein
MHPSILPSLVTKVPTLMVLEACQIRKKGYFGKKYMQEESDSWKEKQHTSMHGRPNDTRVRVFVIHCNG